MRLNREPLFPSKHGRVLVVSRRMRNWVLPTLLVLVSVTVLCATPAHADLPLTANRILGTAVTVDSEGGLVAVGSSSPFSNGQSQAFFFKFAPTGQRVCMKTFGNGEPLDTFGYSVVTDASNNIYITGSTQTFGGEDYDVFLQKYDQSCNLVSTQQWSGPGNDIARGIAVDSADNVYITGSTDSFGANQTQIFLLKFRPSDNEFQFSRIWGGPGNAYGSGVAVDALGNIFVVGTASNSIGGHASVVLLKYDFSGNLLLQKIWGGTMNDYGTAVAVDGAGDAYVTGYTYSSGPTPGVSAVFLLKYDPLGNLLFHQIWGGLMSDYGTGVAVDLDGNVYVVGYTKSLSVHAGAPSALLLKYDQGGTLIFQRSWGGNRGDFAYGVAVDSAENVYVTGYTYSFGPNSQGANFFMLQYDYSGNLSVQKTYGGGIPDP